MAFDNVKGILGVGSTLTSYKLLLMQGACSRPRYRAVFLALLQPFVKDGMITLQYSCYDRMVTSTIRVSELESDYYSTRELGVTDIYQLDWSFHPDLVIDGGGNIGMFTLRASTGLAAAGDKGVEMVICEPVPQNLDQVRRHMELNDVQAEVMPVCLGGAARTIPFYCREANQSSFQADKPYTRVMEIPVVTLQDAIGTRKAERILIKLDIEGMEVEALSTFIPVEQRAVYLVGELHSVPRNGPLMEELFRAHGWYLELLDTGDDACNFRGCSPAALPLLASMRA